MKRLVVASILSIAALLPGVASAVAQHSDVVVQKLRDPKTNKVVGARIHMIAEPENYDTVRVNLGKTEVPAGMTRGSGNDWRNVAAGVTPGYVRAQALEIKNIPHKAGQSGAYGQRQTQEIKVDVHYGVGNDLKPGDKVDIYTTYNNEATNKGYWHVFGMTQGPVQQNDMTHVHELPSETSTHGEATEVAP